MRDVHATGIMNVIEAAPPNSRIVLTSSVVTVGASRDTAAINEESAFNLGHLRIDYVRAKCAAERTALESAALGRDVFVVNPGYLIGPEDFERSVMGRSCVRYWRGMIPVAPPGGVNLVDVRDVALGHLLAAEKGQPGRRYILGGENHAFAGFMAELAVAAGLNPRASPILPYWSLAALAGCGECRAWLTGRYPYPSVQHARLNRYHWFYRLDRATRELGYQSRPISESLQDTLRWFSCRKNLRAKVVSRWWMRPEAIPNRAA